MVLGDFLPGEEDEEGAVWETWGCSLELKLFFHPRGTVREGRSDPNAILTARESHLAQGEHLL